MNISKFKLKQIGKFALEVLGDIIVIFGLFFIIKTYVIAPFEIFGPSMCNYFNYFNGKCNHEYGEYIIINKFGYLKIGKFEVGEPQRGDIIVFHPPNDSEFFIKRIIGLPGDTIVIKEGNVYIQKNSQGDEVRLEEPYLNKESRNNTTTFGINIPKYVVPADSYFVMGDNRPESTDSRVCFKNSCANISEAFVPRENIEGRAWLILWPFSKIKSISHYSYGF